ncbi:MAG TPA: FHA domain-containing protein, partial [Ktedonobacteraceae bacterium]
QELSTSPTPSGKKITQELSTSLTLPGRTSILPPSPLPSISQQDTPDLQLNQHTPPEHQETPIPSLIIAGQEVAEPREIKLVGTEITIGRAGSSDVLLEDDELASRHQATIKFAYGLYLLYDCRSVHGTTLNGQKLASDVGYTLHDGDLIGIGIHNLTFVLKQE